MPKFSRRSRDALKSCDARLQHVCQRVIENYDFTVLEGHRSIDRQNELFRQGKSKLKGGQSKHNAYPSKAIDIVPAPIDWENIERFYLLAGFMFQAASEMGVVLRWGGDWNRNWDHTDQSFFDYPHFELVEDK